MNQLATFLTSLALLSCIACDTTYVPGDSAVIAPSSGEASVKLVSTPAGKTTTAANCTLYSGATIKVLQPAQNRWLEVQAMTNMYGTSEKGLGCVGWISVRDLKKM